MHNFYYNFFKNKKILITGASGKIGSVITEYFNKSKAKLILIDKNIVNLEKKYKKGKKNKIEY